MSENTTIELKPDQAALIVDEDFGMEAYITHTGDDNDDTPLNVRYITMLAILTKSDEGFIKDILDKFQKVAEDIMEEDEGEDK